MLRKICVTLLLAVNVVSATNHTTTQDYNGTRYSAAPTLVTDPAVNISSNTELATPNATNSTPWQTTTIVTQVTNAATTPYPGTEETDTVNTGRSNVSSSVTTNGPTATARKQVLVEKLSKECDLMKQRERSSVVSVHITWNGLTVDHWVENVDTVFRSDVAKSLNDLAQPSNITFNADDLVYVRPSPQDVGKDKIQIYVYLKDEKISRLEKEISGDARNLVDFRVDQIMKKGVEAALNNSEVKVIDISIKYAVSNGLPWPDCSSLFRAYLWLWIVIIVAVVFMIMGSVVLTCYCWRRGKSVELKSPKNPSSLPTCTDELSGHDNQAMVILVEDTPTKKKQAPKPPSTDMSTFGKSEETDNGTQYETAVTPFTTRDAVETPNVNGDDKNANGQLAPKNIELQDTRL